MLQMKSLTAVEQMCGYTISPVRSCAWLPTMGHAEGPPRTVRFALGCTHIRRGYFPRGKERDRIALTRRERFSGPTNDVSEILSPSRSGCLEPGTDPPSRRQGRGPVLTASAWSSRHHTSHGTATIALARFSYTSIFPARQVDVLVPTPVRLVQDLGPQPMRAVGIIAHVRVPVHLARQYPARTEECLRRATLNVARTPHRSALSLVTAHRPSSSLPSGPPHRDSLRPARAT
jgi:hypothetical protein